MPIPIDYKLDKIIKEIQAELKKEYGKDVAYTTVVKVIEQQCKATVKGMSEGHTITWKFLGNFVATKKRVDSLNKQYEKRGKVPTLLDNGLVRISFTRTGIENGTTKLVGNRKSDVLGQGEFNIK